MAAIGRRAGCLVLQLMKQNRKTFYDQLLDPSKTTALLGSCRGKKNKKVTFSHEELRKRLTPLQYHVTQEKGTESAFEGEYTYNKAIGIYKCVVCGSPLFKSETKFDSNSESPHLFYIVATKTECRIPSVALLRHYKVILTLHVILILFLCLSQCCFMNIT